MDAPAPPPVSCPAARPAAVRALDRAIAAAALPVGARREVRGALHALARAAGRRRTDLVGRREACVLLVSSGRILQRRPLGAPRARLVAAEARANATWLRSAALPPPRTRIERGGVVLQRYDGLGLRVMPLAGWASAGAAARGGRTDDAVRRVEAMLRLATPARRGVLRIEYAFPFGSPHVLWTSAIADGSAIEALIDLAAALALRDGTGDAARAARYRATAVAIARDLLRIGDEGTGDGGEATTWFPLYAQRSTERVLNAHLEAVIALGRLADVVDEAWIAAAHARGLAATADEIARFDLGTWSAYARGVDAPLEYHDLQTLFLRRLANQTGDAGWRAWARRFDAYRAEPPDVSAVGERLARGPGGVPRSLSVVVTATKPATLDVVVAHARSPVERLTTIDVGPSRPVRIAVPLLDGEELVDLRLRGADVTGMPIVLDTPVTAWPADGGDGSGG